MSRTTLRWFRRFIYLNLVLCGFGCSSPMSMLWFLNRGDGKVPAEYKFEPVANKKDMTVAVVVTCSPSLQMMSAENASLDRELTTHISQVLVNESKESRVPIKVVDSAKVQQIKSSNPALWDNGSRGELAKKLGADYLLEVYVNSFQLDSKQFGGEITVGHATLNVAVYRAGSDTEPVYNYAHTSNPSFRDTRSMNPHHYRVVYVKQLGDEIAHKHVEHVPDRDRAMPK